MCLTPSQPKDNSAQIAEQKEKERQDRIKAGQAAIDDAFGQFNDDYYGNISSGYTSYYNPQVDQQYKDALDKLTLQLGQQGILQSSEGSKQIGKLQENYQQQKSRSSMPQSPPPIKRSRTWRTRKRSFTIKITFRQIRARLRNPQRPQHLRPWRRQCIARSAHCLPACLALAPTRSPCSKVALSTQEARARIFRYSRKRKA